MLFVINFFITFFLLQITAKLCKRPGNAVRFILASSVGGLYSLIILLDDINELLLSLSKIVACIVIVSIGFSFSRLRSFLMTVGIFLFSNYIMLGIIVGLYYLSKSQHIVVRNSSVYLDISARGLVVASFLAYIVSTVVIRVHSRVLSKKEVYTLVVSNKGREATFVAMLDTGNKLREPFSNSPVIIVDSLKGKPLVGEQTRVVPVNTVSGSTLLQSFKPDKIILKSSAGQEVIDNAYVALSDDINDNMYSAIINPDILSV
ncbi:MAG: sigma-E processing peptidase SpoIIGA [Eubacterium sp.]